MNLDHVTICTRDLPARLKDNEKCFLSDLHLLRQSTPFQTGTRIKNPDERLGRHKLMAPP